MDELASITVMAVSMLVGGWFGTGYQTYSIQQDCKNYGATMLFDVKYTCQKAEKEQKWLNK